MDLTVATNIIEVIKFLFQQFGIAFEWTGENILPYLSELVQKFGAYKAAEHSIFVGLGGILLLFGVFLMIFNYVRAHKENEWQDGTVGGFLFGVAFMLVGIIITVIALVNLVEVVNFPELTFFQYIEGYLGK